MPKSVDRLSQELVTASKLIRTTTTNNTGNGRQGHGKKKQSESYSTSNNTRNEDTCPNAMSIPSLGVTVPMIASINDEEATHNDA